MPRDRRYAIYFVPDGALGDFGASWLGWDIRNGTVAAPADLPGLPVPAVELTTRPRKYGFHATVKAPFFLAAGETEDRLDEAARAACASLSPVRLETLQVARMGAFLALLAVGEDLELQSGAARVVEALDRFRAPPGAAELARRRLTRLSDTQEANLRKWGYPYVMEAFQFHITLTGPLEPSVANRCQAVLGDALRPLLPRPFVVESLALVRSDRDGRFHLLHRYPLLGQDASPT